MAGESLRGDDTDDKQWEMLSDIREEMARLSTAQEGIAGALEEQRRINEDSDRLSDKLISVEKDVSSFSWLKAVIPIMFLALIGMVISLAYYSFQMQMLHEADLRVISQLITNSHGAGGVAIPNATIPPLMSK